MDTRENMIIVKGEIKTSDIKFCQYNQEENRIDILYTNGKKYPYAHANVKWLKNPQVLNPKIYQISREGVVFFNIDAIYVFKENDDTYYHICFEDGSERDYQKNDLKIEESCLSHEESKNVFQYIKQISELSNVRNEETGEKILTKRLDEIPFVGKQVALAKYLKPSLLQVNNKTSDYIPIFPFGCNNSQYVAVKNAMENQISIIQGPPGTGKTQTILNIISNI